MDDGGESRSDPVGNLLSLALHQRDEEAAQAYDAELRQLARHDAISATTCHLVGEAYEEHGQLRQALRWFSIHFIHADPLDDPIDEMLLVARRRVRVELRLAPDRLDQLVDDL